MTAFLASISLFCCVGDGMTLTESFSKSNSGSIIFLFLFGTSCLKERDCFLLFYTPKSHLASPYRGCTVPQVSPSKPVQGMFYTPSLTQQAYRANPYRRCSAWSGNFCDYGSLYTCAGHMADLLCSNMKFYHPTWSLSGLKIRFHLLAGRDGSTTKSTCCKLKDLSLDPQCPRLPHKSQLWLCSLVTEGDKVGGLRERQEDSGSSLVNQTD